MEFSQLTGKSNRKVMYPHMKFEITTNPFGDDKPLYRRKNIEIKPGLTILVGCNGSGKTTLIHQIKNILQDKNIEFVNLYMS